MERGESASVRRREGLRDDVVCLMTLRARESVRAREQEQEQEPEQENETESEQERER